MDAQRALLDELMGAARNLTDEERKGFKEMSWDDKDVCRPYMIRFCPHDLFVNTRSDLGADNISNYYTTLRTYDLSFEKSPRHDAFVPKFKAELAHFCERLVMDLDRRVRRGQERLSQEVEPAPPLPISSEKSEQRSVLEDKIKNLLDQVEELGEAGKVDEAEVLMRMVEMLNTEKTALTQPLQNEKVTMLAQDKKMALCEICGSFLVANDVVERSQAHLTGKQHIGYGMVRDFIAECKAARETAMDEERLAREKETEERKSWDKEHEGNLKRGGSRDRDRDHDNGRGIDREHHRDHSNSRERYKREYRDNGRTGDGRHNNSYENAGGRDKYCERNRSRSPVRHGRRRSRSPLH